MLNSPRPAVIALLLLIAPLAATRARAGPDFSFQSFDPPAGVDSPVGDSIAFGVSNNGTVIGLYVSADSTAHGYMRLGGVYTYFDAPGAGTGNYDGTEGLSVNSSGQAIFQSVDNSGNLTSYLYHAGQYMAIADPAAAANQTYAEGINDQGIATGSYIDASGGQHTFEYNTASGVFSNLPDVPGALASYGQFTAANGDTVVNYLNSSNMVAAALYHAATGTYTDLGIAGATDFRADGINSSGTISGHYTDASGDNHGFEYINGTYDTIDYPGGPGIQTFLFEINDAGVAAGYYYDSSFEAHSFLVQTVPEPSSFAMCAIAGVAGLVVARRRMRTAA